jgi:hypothetical protein
LCSIEVWRTATDNEFSVLDTQVHNLEFRTGFFGTKSQHGNRLALMSVPMHLNSRLPKAIRNLI